MSEPRKKHTIAMSELCQSGRLRADAAWGKCLSREAVYGSIICPEKTPEKQHQLARRVATFWSQDMLKEALLPYICREAPISLRLVEWTLCNYAKVYQPVYKHVNPRTNRSITVDLHYSYLAALTRFRRRHYGPVRRGNRVFVKVGNERHETTIAQLVFFKWAYECGVMQFIVAHEKTLKAHHSKCVKQRKSVESSGKQSRKPYLTEPAETCRIFSMKTEESLS